MSTVSKKTPAERQAAHLWASQQTYYAEPLTLIEGNGTHVRDDRGHDYLDAFGGIATNTVGHNHPELVAAIADQASKLIHVSTLYLNEPMLDFAEAIADVAPQGMTKSFISNSGSEANEMAALAARTARKSADLLALQHAYHGRTLYTAALAGLSTWRNFGPQMPHVAFVPNPYCYRCPLKLSYPSCDIACARAAKDVIESATNGAPAAMIAETIAGVGGIITPPPEYYKVLQETLAPFGTLLIADEVQTGWGRLGDGMFGMPSTYGVIPDIITSAKGVASGMPMGITITRPELADAFQGPHINTFGGNPLASRAGHVTLQLIAKEHLIANSKRQGQRLMGGLGELQKRYQHIGEVRGHGLMIGIELVKDRVSKVPAGNEAARVLQGMKDRGVLVGRGGRWGSVIRVQPPLVFDDRDSDDFLRVFEETMQSL